MALLSIFTQVPRTVDHKWIGVIYEDVFASAAGPESNAADSADDGAGPLRKH